MKVYFGQCYIVAGADFPFSHHFQRRISEQISAAVEPSEQFIKYYGRDFDLTFNISAKRDIKDNEIVGPTVYRKTKDVEYTVFLPFDVISRSSQVPESALRFLLKGTCFVFELLGIDATQVVRQQEAMIKEICADPMILQKA
jgi:hypothetical protein